MHHSSPLIILSLLFSFALFSYADSDSEFDFKSSRREKIKRDQTFKNSEVRKLHLRKQFSPERFNHNEYEELKIDRAINPDEESSAQDAIWDWPEEEDLEPRKNYSFDDFENSPLLEMKSNAWQPDSLDKINCRQVQSKSRYQ